MKWIVPLLGGSASLAGQGGRQFVLKPQTPVLVDSVKDFEHLSSQFLAFAFAVGKARAG